MKPIVGRWHFPHSSPATYETPCWIKRFFMKIIGVEWREE